MAFADRLRSRLALKIYLIGIAQMAVVAAGFVSYAWLSRPDFAAREAKEDALAATIVSLLDDPAALQRAIEEQQEELAATVTVSDPDGRVLASTTPPDAPPCLRPRPLLRPETGEVGRPSTLDPADLPPDTPDIRRPRFRGATCRIAFLRFPSGAYGRIEFRPTKPPRPPSPFGLPVVVFVLVVVGISSILLARSIARPLRRLAEAARAFGEGDLESRTRIERGDELGDVARSFDEMAVRLRDVLRAEKELVANVSHELRTPLSRIRVALDIAQEGDTSAARESLAEIAGDVDELERLVGDLLTAARLDSGALSLTSGGIPPLRKERLDLGSLLAQTIDRFRATHGERVLEVKIAPELPHIEGDPILLRRVVDNLLENAHKYSPDPATPIGIVAHIEGADLVIEISDQGIGIAAADRERVFEPFFRADRSRTRATGGHGLGLALAKRVIEAHGGTISLSSRPGSGTLVSVRLPV